MHVWQANTERTCALPVVFRAMPEDEKPPAMRADFYLPLYTSVQQQKRHRNCPRLRKQKGKGNHPFVVENGGSL